MDKNQVGRLFSGKHRYEAPVLKLVQFQGDAVLSSTGLMEWNSDWLIVFDDTRDNTLID